jgi:hypothetical protein
MQIHPGGKLGTSWDWLIDWYLLFFLPHEICVQDNGKLNVGYIDTFCRFPSLLFSKWQWRRLLTEPSPPLPPSIQAASPPASNPRVPAFPLHLAVIYGCCTRWTRAACDGRWTLAEPTLSAAGVLCRSNNTRFIDGLSCLDAFEVKHNYSIILWTHEIHLKGRINICLTVELWHGVTQPCLVDDWLLAALLIEVRMKL